MAYQPALPPGQATMANSAPVVIASDQTAVPVDSELTTADLDTGAGTDTRAVVGIALAASGGAVLVGAANPIPADITKIGGATLTIGQQLAAASIPVILPAATVTTLTPPAAITGFALETGGNLAAAAASLSVIDDWDESDRAKVNPIVGQAGVQGGSGTVSALTQRVVLATDVALPAGTNVIGHMIVDSGGITETNSGAIKTAVEKIDDIQGALVVDDAAFTPATTTVLMAGFEFDDASPDSVNEGDAGAARMSANRNIYTTLRDAAGNERGANVTASNAILVDLSATTANSQAILVDASAGLVVVKGNLTTNNGAPGSTNVGVLPAIANTSAPSYTDGRQVLLSTDTAGGIRLAAETTKVIGTVTAGTGTASIGKISDITTSVTPGTSAGHLGKAASTGVYASGDTGIAMLGVRNDQLAATLNANDQDYGVIAVDGNGRVAITGQIQAAISTYSQGSTGSRLNSGYALFDDDSPAAAVEGRFDAFRMSSNRVLYGMIRDGAGNERGAKVDTDGRLSVVGSPQLSLNFATDTVDVSGSMVHVVNTVVTAPTNSTIASTTAKIVTTTAVRLVGTNVARKALLIANNGNGGLYIGHDSSVTSSGATMGVLVSSTSSYSDSGFGTYIGELWGIYDAASSSYNVTVVDRS